MRGKIEAWFSPSHGTTSMPHFYSLLSPWIFIAEIPLIWDETQPCYGLICGILETWDETQQCSGLICGVLETHVYSRYLICQKEQYYFVLYLLFTDISFFIGENENELVLRQGSEYRVRPGYPVFDRHLDLSQSNMDIFTFGQTQSS